MSEASLDVVAIGNAIMDVIANADDEFLAAEGLTAGSMQLIDGARAVELYGKMGPGREVSGGAAANTLSSLALLGGRAGFVAQVADDQLGEVYRHDLRSIGVQFDTPARAGEPTGRCLILVSPDGQRTMNTLLGAAQSLPAAAIDETLIASAKILFLEGYLWDPPEPRAAMRRAAEVARAAGRKVALATCADFCVHMHGKDFRALIDQGLIDILFANEEEVAILEGSTADEAIESLSKSVPLLVVTRGPNGAVAVKDGERTEIAAEPIDRVVDTTGAGDSFAGGFLAGLTQGRSIQECLTMGAVVAAEVISHYGARPEADLKALVAKRLG